MSTLNGSTLNLGTKTDWGFGLLVIEKGVERRKVCSRGKKVRRKTDGRKGKIQEG